MLRRAIRDDDLTGDVIGAFFEVYNTLGYGFLEQLYVSALERELTARGHHVTRELGVVIWYKNEELGMQRLDMVVDDRLVIEVKSTEQLHPNARRQLYNYLKATRLPLGLLLHFGPDPKVRRETLDRPRSRSALSRASTQSGP